MDLQSNLGGEKVVGLDSKLQEILDLMGNTNVEESPINAKMDYNTLNEARMSLAMSEYELDGDKFYTPTASEGKASISSCSSKSEQTEPEAWELKREEEIQR